MSGSVAATDSTVVDTVLSIDPLKKRLISTLYGKLLDLRSTPTDKLKTAWEKELGLLLSGDTWVSILKLVNSTSLCANRCLIQFKVVHRAHISKAKLSSIYLGISPYCVKCKHVEASLIHMYWSCSSLNKYWWEVFHTLSRVLNIKLDPNPLTALFGVMEGEKRLTTAIQCTIFCLPSGSTSNSAQVEGCSSSHSYTMAGRHHVLLKTGENQVLTSAFK